MKSKCCGASLEECDGALLGGASCDTPQCSKCKKHVYADLRKSDQLKLLKFAFFRLNGNVPEDKLLEGCIRDFKGDIK